MSFTIPSVRDGKELSRGENDLGIYQTVGKRGYSTFQGRIYSNSADVEKAHQIALQNISHPSALSPYSLQRESKSELAPTNLDSSHIYSPEKLAALREERLWEEGAVLSLSDPQDLLTRPTEFKTTSRLFLNKSKHNPIDNPGINWKNRPLYKRIGKWFVDSVVTNPYKLFLREPAKAVIDTAQGHPMEGLEKIKNQLERTGKDFLNPIVNEIENVTGSQSIHFEVPILRIPTSSEPKPRKRTVINPPTGCIRTYSDSIEDTGSSTPKSQLPSPKARSTSNSSSLPGKVSPSPPSASNSTEREIPSKYAHPALEMAKIAGKNLGEFFVDEIPYISLARKANNLEEFKKSLVTHVVLQKGSVAVNAFEKMAKGTQEMFDYVNECRRINPKGLEESASIYGTLALNPMGLAAVRNYATSTISSLEETINSITEDTIGSTEDTIGSTSIDSSPLGIEDISGILLLNPVNYTAVKNSSNR